MRFIHGKQFPTGRFRTPALWISNCTADAAFAEGRVAPNKSSGARPMSEIPAQLHNVLPPAEEHESHENQHDPQGLVY
jgi:hypothetical protein